MKRRILEGRRRTPAAISSGMRRRKKRGFAVAERRNQRIVPIVERERVGRSACTKRSVGGDRDHGWLADAFDETQRPIDSESLVEPAKRVCRTVRRFGPPDEALEQTQSTLQWPVSAHRR